MTCLFPLLPCDRFNGLMGVNSRNGIKDATDGTTNVVLAGESTGGCNFAMGDGSVRFMSENVNLALYQRMGAMADGLPIGDVEF